MWERKEQEWRPLDLHTVQAIGPNSRALLGEDKTPKHLSRLWRIIISESAHLIWRLRCERVIGHSEDRDWQHAAKEIRARWLAMMNSRLRHDIEGTKKKYGRLALRKNLVLQTWERMIGDKANLPKDWTSVRRVLVGIDSSVADELQ